MIKCLGTNKGNKPLEQVWVYSSQALTILSGLPDLLIGLAGGLGQEGVFEHLGEVEHLVFVRSEGGVYDKTSKRLTFAISISGLNKEMYFTGLTLSKRSSLITEVVTKEKFSTTQ